MTLHSLITTVLTGLFLSSTCAEAADALDRSVQPDKVQVFEQKPSRIAGQTHPGTSDGLGLGLLPGVGLAQGISEITGAAISPLLGVSAIGAWKYWHTATPSRARLPWYCQPWAWGPGLGIIALCFFKDLFGSLVPGIFKKPLDWLELFENKASALVASTAFVPLVAMAMSEYQRIAPDQAHLNSSLHGLAQAPVADILAFSLQSPWITLPLSLALFTVVWLTSHAVHVLIALSPFGLLDSALKLVKLAVLSVVTACAAMIPSVSAAPALLLCMLITLVCALLVGWSYRLLVFGCVMVGDLLFRRQPGPDQIQNEGIVVFLSRPMQDLPVRTLGRLRINPAGGALTFTRRFSLRPTRQSFTLPEMDLGLQKGLLYPGLFSRNSATGRRVSLAILPPRYRAHESMAAAALGVTEILECPLTRSFQSMKEWLLNLLSGRGEIVKDRPS